MPSNARLGDLWLGTCICHSPPIPMTGPIISASPDRIVEGMGQARLTDVVIGGCGHTGFISSASATAFTNNLGDARIGDFVSGCTIGVIITGASAHTTD